MAEDPLGNAIWEALASSHRGLAEVQGLARRYPERVAPFAAIQEQSEAAMRDLSALLRPGEHVYLMGSRPPEAPGLQWDGIVPCLQMLFPDAEPLPAVPEEIEVEPLDCGNAPEMVDLIEVAFPGYFRAETCRMGRYYGVRDRAGQLVAMGGERLVLDPFREISGLATHPAHRGRGLGTAVLRRVIADQRGAGAVSWLHVAEANTHAVELYRKLGFQVLRRVELHRIRRIAEA